MKYLSNAFSLNMINLEAGDQCQFTVRNCGINGARTFVADKNVVSTVGHQDTANLFCNLLDTPVVCRRTTVEMKSGDKMLVGQYKGPRLPEGCSVLPEGAIVEWFIVSLTNCCL